jgi:DNA-binding NtrC family response regulator
MPAATQAKLLRVLEDRAFRRLGSKVETPIDVRVVAATNKNPQEAVENGELRGDLFYRLNVFNIQMPPLREHLVDVQAIAEKMIDDMNARHDCTVQGMSEELLAKLTAYDWPGNVRELRNTIERATILAGSGTIGVEHLPPNFGEPGFSPLARQSRNTRRPVMPGDPPQPYSPERRAEERREERMVSVEVGTTVDEAERQLILKTLQSTQNNKTRAAEILGISSKTLQNKLKEYSSSMRTD